MGSKGTDEKPNVDLGDRTKHPNFWKPSGDDEADDRAIMEYFHEHQGVPLVIGSDGKLTYGAKVEQEGGEDDGDDDDDAGPKYYYVKKHRPMGQMLYEDEVVEEHRPDSPNLAPDFETEFELWLAPDVDGEDEGKDNRKVDKAQDRPTPHPAEKETCRLYATEINRMADAGDLPWSEEDRRHFESLPQQAYPLPEDRARHIWPVGKVFPAVSETDDATAPASIYDHHTPTFFGYLPHHSRPKLLGRGFHGYDDVYDLQARGVKLDKNNVPPRPRRVMDLQEDLTFLREDGTAGMRVDARAEISADNPIMDHIDRSSLAPNQHLADKVTGKAGKWQKGRK